MKKFLVVVVSVLIIGLSLQSCNNETLQSRVEDKLMTELFNPSSYEFISIDTISVITKEKFIEYTKSMATNGDLKKYNSLMEDSKSMFDLYNQFKCSEISYYEKIYSKYSDISVNVFNIEEKYSNIGASEKCYIYYKLYERDASEEFNKLKTDSIIIKNINLQGDTLSINNYIIYKINYRATNKFGGKIIAETTFTLLPYTNEIKFLPNDSYISVELNNYINLIK